MQINLKKTFIFDTNILIDDHKSIYRYGESLIIIPIVVLEELDKLKTKDGKVGEAARRANRELERLRLQALENNSFLSRGFDLPNGSVIKIWAGKTKVIPQGMDFEKNDNQILMVAYEFKKMSEDREVILLSNDINVRVKADGLGIFAQKHNADELSDQLYSGISEDVFLPKRVIDSIYKAGFLKIEETFANTGYQNVLDSLHENMFGCIKSIESDKSSALVRYNRGHDGSWIASKIDGTDAFGTRGRNAEQRFALNALLDPSITLVTLVGPPGTGKTFCALAAALESCQGGGNSFFHPDDYRKNGQKGKRGRRQKSYDDYESFDYEQDSEYMKMKGTFKSSNSFDKIVVTKPIVPMGREIGFLPGTLEEKMQPWLQPIWDNLESLAGKENVQFLQDPQTGIIEINALTHIRGRSIANTFMIIDEAQNLSRHEIKTILTRMAEGSKLVLTGDVEQIDDSYLDRFNNGLTIVLEKFKDKKYSAHLTLREGQRLQMVSDAAQLL